MIISVHMPKTAGSSFKMILKHHFKNGYRADYGDYPLNTPIKERIDDAKKFDASISLLTKFTYKVSNTKCIHGHFLPYKYNKLIKDKNTSTITWLREPTERLISHYYYWKRTFSQDSGPLHRQMIEEDWSLEEFCLSEELKNIYDQFLWNFPIEHFDFIGLSEFFDEDLAYFIKRYIPNYKLEATPQTNRNISQSGLYKDEISKELAEKIKLHHARDYELYEYACEQRKIR